MSNIEIGRFSGRLLAVLLILLFLSGGICSLRHCSQKSRETLQEKYKITDQILNSLVEQRATFEEMSSRYGPPAFVYGKQEGRMIAFFEMGLRHSEFLPPMIGRIGFRADFEKGVLISWSETTRSK